MDNYLDNIVSYTSKAQVKIAALALEAATSISNGGAPFQQIDNINWYTMLLTGANDTTQDTTLRLQLLTLLVDNARLNEVPLVNVFGLYQTLGDSTITASAWGLIGGNINDQLDLIAKFNTYLPLSAGVTKPLTGALYFGADDLGIDVINEGDTINIGASAGVVQFGLDAEVKLNTITEGAWLATNIGVAYGGLGNLDFASGTNGQAIIKSGSGYAFYTIPAIPSLAGYIKADGTVPMTADLLFPISKGIDTTGAGTLFIGQNNATAVQIFQSLSLSAVVAGNWQADPVELGFGGTGASLTAPAASSFFVYDSGVSSFAEIGDNLSLSGGVINLASVLTNIDWRGDVISVDYGGTGLSTVGAEGDVFTVVGGVPAWATFTALTNPMDGAGQMIYGGAAGIPTKLNPNATSTNRFLRSVSSGNPSWEILVAGDIPNIAQSQVTGLTTALTNKLGTTLTDGYMYVGNAANAAVGVQMYGDATIDNSGSLLIADEAVTFAKMQNITATTLVGRWSAGDGPMQEVTIGSGLSLSLTGVLTSGGLVNPMTTIGDIIIGDTGGDPIRLAAGTNGYILTMVSGSPAWAVAASGSGNVVGPGPTVVDGNFAVYNGTGGLTIGQPSIASLDTGGNASFASLKITGTGGNGHMHLRHQASAVAGIGSSNTIYALATGSNGFGFVINNAAYASSLVFGATAARTYTLPDLTGTVALLANPAPFTSVTVGTASSLAGDVVFQNATNATTQTFRGTNPTSSIVYLLPTTAPTASQVLTSTVPSAGVATLSWTSVSGAGVTSVGTFSGSAQTDGANITGTTITFGPADATTPGMVSTGAQTWAGAKTFNSNIFFGAGAAAPTLTTRSAGTKLVLSPTLSGVALDYAWGVGLATLWGSLGASTDQFILYAPIASVVTAFFTITPSTAMTFNGSSLAFGTSSTSANVRAGSSDQGLISRNFINLGTGGGTAVPAAIGASWASRSLGTRVIVQSTSTTTQADMAIGYNTNEMWMSLFTATSASSLGWYGAATKIMTLRGDGLLTLTGTLALRAGAAAVGSAPLAFTSGTNLTTPVNGSMEYNGTNLFFTRTGAVREGVLTQSAVTTEVLVSDTSVTINIGGTTYKLLAKA